ncbi:alpha/beta hydrolase [Rariglobus hedericola]|uniref:Alpha/beta hydrolase n=2 Tax=Rariglobus hedericola TaxID=2597822 RepID=A0A556QSW2_9BACT|nr:alpha/beta hydrolase [Rariglobus hedericola]
MQVVLDQYARLVPQPIATLTTAEARRQPTLADAVNAVLKTRGKRGGSEPVAQIADRAIAGPAGEIRLRVYTPTADGTGPMPVIIYFHGGGFVIGSVDSYDASARALTNAAKAIVISAHYRQGPENKFPAATEDAFAAYQWTLAHAAEINGDPRRIAVAGEGAGGNLAAGVCIRARDSNVPVPLHQLLIYPLLDSRTDTPSYSENTNVIPFGRPLIDWYLDHSVSPADRINPRFALLRAASFDDLPPATIITAQIDPLRSEGETYARKLREARVDVAHRNYEGVVHDFFGLGAVVPQARSAVVFAGGRLQQAFKDAAPIGR